MGSSPSKRRLESKRCGGDLSSNRGVGATHAANRGDASWGGTTTVGRQDVLAQNEGGADRTCLFPSIMPILAPSKEGHSPGWVQCRCVPPVFQHRCEWEAFEEGWLERGTHHEEK